MKKNTQKLSIKTKEIVLRKEEKKRFFLINLADISNLHNKGEQYVYYALIQLLLL
jgi:hypothetical protein